MVLQTPSDSGQLAFQLTETQATPVWDDAVYSTRPKLLITPPYELDMAGTRYPGGLPYLSAGEPSFRMIDVVHLVWQ
jgi:hypothetical protein